MHYELDNTYLPLDKLTLSLVLESLFHMNIMWLFPLLVEFTLILGATLRRATIARRVVLLLES